MHTPPSVFVDWLRKYVFGDQNGQKIHPILTWQRQFTSHSCRIVSKRMSDPQKFYFDIGGIDLQKFQSQVVYSVCKEMEGIVMTIIAIFALIC